VLLSIVTDATSPRVSTQSLYEPMIRSFPDRAISVFVTSSGVMILSRLLGDELFGGVGVTYALPAVRGVWCDANQVRITGELVGVLGNDVGDKLGPSPAEGRLGVITRIRPWLAVAVRAGKGIGDQIGSPRFRGMLELVYNPR
jgi:hypothetical protein